MRQNKKLTGRKGSALLIVLGMLSFMVVSAVGFSVYMRQSRAPSSYLSRNVSSRYLVKAALANAIEELEGGFATEYELGLGNSTESGYFFGVYDDPYPGVGPQSGDSFRSEDDDRTGRSVRFTDNGDFWFKRVFCPFGLLDSPKNAKAALQETPLAAPTLTLEALAYLPPAIVDDVRKVSRLTRTAVWKSLPYQTGRYAYTAVNVSDLFDINKLRASYARDSGVNRITLATLTSSDPEDPTSVDKNAADRLDELLEKPEESKIGGQVVPFVSLADFNVMGSKFVSDYAPLMKYIGGTSQYVLPEKSSTEGKRVANAMFVTDTWFPSTNAAGTAGYDLGGVRGGGQPFQDFTAAADSIRNVCQSKVLGGKDGIWAKNLSVGLACLYDYLDSDSIPISLAFPTTEAVPMVVGVGCPTHLRPNVKAESLPQNPVQVKQGNYTYNVTRTLTRYMIEDFADSGKVFVNASLMFPFKRMKTSKRETSFKVRGLLRVFLGDQGLTADNFKCRQNVNDIDKLKPDKALFGSTKVYDQGVASFASASKTVTFNSDVTDQVGRNWIQDVSLEFDAELSVPILQEVSETWVAVNLDPDNPAPPVTKQPVTTLDGLLDKNSPGAVFHPFFNDQTRRITSANWCQGFSLDDPVTDAKSKPIDQIQPFAQTGKYRLFATVWIQVLDANDKVVDMVPACSTSDEDWCQPGGNSYGDNGPLLGTAVCEEEPILPFVSDNIAAVEFSTGIGKTFGTATSTYQGWDCLLAVDPRFNHAPENWVCLENTSGSGLKDKWCTAMGVDGGSKVFGVNGRDRDVFMFVSDQEYLQSVGELQFLPYLNDLDGNGNWSSPQFSTAFRCKGEPFSKRKLSGSALDLDNADMKKELADIDYFWQTYSAYKKVNGDSDQDVAYYNPYTLPIRNDSVTFKVNPYSDDNRVLAAALVGTPFDYYIASTNSNQTNAKNRNTLAGTLTLDDEEYFFGPNSTAAKLTKGDLMGDGKTEGIADRIIDCFGAVTDGTDWNLVWDKLEWQDPTDATKCGDNNEFIGATLSVPLHGVDRKYLYSFWRDCFANQQQLFLVFVRAEPASIGGGASGGVSSAQLGARAVALVWRDPSVPSGTSGSRPKRSTLRGRIDLEKFRDLKRQHPPHRTRVLFYHQFD